jgi:hypothetical protein
MRRLGQAYIFIVLSLTSILLANWSDDLGTAKTKLKDLYTFSGGSLGGTFQYYTSAIATMSNPLKILIG